MLHGVYNAMHAVENPLIQNTKLIFFSVFVQDGKSSLDLARERGNTDIHSVLEMHPTMSSGSDAFMTLLSGYMAEKEKAKKNVSYEC